MSIKLIFKAALGDGPEQIVGSYNPSDDEWSELLGEFQSEEDWLNNQGIDFAYDAVHTDCLRCWTEIERS